MSVKGKIKLHVISVLSEEKEKKMPVGVYIKWGKNVLYADINEFRPDPSLYLKKSVTYNANLEFEQEFLCSDKFDYTCKAGVLPDHINILRKIIIPEKNLKFVNVR